MTHISMPDHAGLFHYNTGLGLSGEGYQTWINIQNYYTTDMFENGYNSRAIAEIQVVDEDGQEGETLRQVIEPYGSCHYLVDDLLPGGKGRNKRTFSAVFARLVPETVPERMKGKRISTEFTCEVTAPGGSRDFMHNVGGRARMPSLGRRETGLLFADQVTRPVYLLLANNYFGPQLPLVSDGFARFLLINHKGEERLVETPKVPARCIRLFSLKEAIPDLEAFLDGHSGVMKFTCVNLARKPWIWFGDKNGSGEMCLEHL